jgi:hypothetical protein
LTPKQVVGARECDRRENGDAESVWMRLIRSMPSSTSISPRPMPTVNSEPDRLGRPRDLGAPQRTPDPLDPHS